MNRFLFIFTIFSLLIFSCEYKEVVPIEESDESCEGCHTNYALLKQVYTPDTAVVSGGCGGDAPHYEPYDRVFMGGTGYDEFKTSSHYDVGCVGCHNGTDNVGDKSLAHSGNFISHPSSVYKEKCGTCHQTIANNFETSIHNGTGQKRKVAMRSGLSGPADFDQLPAHLIEGYTNNCATCHGTCGNCHVVRPSAGGGGLISGHKFNKTPDMVNVCITCHSSRGGHAYLGVAPGTVPDVHLTNNSFKCMNCHSGDEIHGDGVPVDQRYEYTKLPKCTNCHSDIASSNAYHLNHYEDFNCQVCHSQDYNNCGSCHVHDEGARIPSYQGFKIALNPLPDVKADYKFVLVRRTLAAPDNWSVYGVEDYANFEAFPTYNFTTPHNIIKWTSRTTVAEGSACYENCHAINDGTQILNKELYLFNDDLLDWEIGASGNITVDGQLPANWSKK